MSAKSPEAAQSFRGKRGSGAEAGAPDGIKSTQRSLAPACLHSGFSMRGFSRYGVLHFYSCMFSEYVWVTGVEASHVCAKFSQPCFDVCILEPLLNHHFIDHHLRVPDTCVRVTRADGIGTVRDGSDWEDACSRSRVGGVQRLTAYSAWHVSYSVKLRLASQRVLVLRSSSWMVDLCGRHSRVGSLTGVAHQKWISTQT